MSQAQERVKILPDRDGERRIAVTDLAAHQTDGVLELPIELRIRGLELGRLSLGNTSHVHLVLLDLAQPDRLVVICPFVDEKHTAAFRPRQKGFREPSYLMGFPEFSGSEMCAREVGEFGQNGMKTGRRLIRFVEANQEGRVKSTVGRNELLDTEAGVVANILCAITSTFFTPWNTRARPPGFISRFMPD